MPLSGQTAPREQLARSQSIPPRRRRYLPPPIVALAHDPALLFQRPTTPGTSLDHLKSRHLRHSRMISHTPMSSPPHPSHKAVLSAGIPYLRLSVSCLEIMGRNGHIQHFRIVWIRTGFGRHRPILICGSCDCGAIRLFRRYGTYACRHCHKALYASQKHDQNGRKRLAACKLRLELGGWPDIGEPSPPKAKWKHHRTYNKARKRLDNLEAPIKTYRFKKLLSTQLFAYHVV